MDTEQPRGSKEVLSSAKASFPFSRVVVKSDTWTGERIIKHVTKPALTWIDGTTYHFTTELPLIMDEWATHLSQKYVKVILYPLEPGIQPLTIPGCTVTAEITDQVTKKCRFFILANVPRQRVKRQTVVTIRIPLTYSQKRMIRMLEDL